MNFDFSYIYVDSPYMSTFHRVKILLHKTNYWLLLEYVAKPIS